MYIVSFCGVEVKCSTVKHCALCTHTITNPHTLSTCWYFCSRDILSTSCSNDKRRLIVGRFQPRRSSSATKLFWFCSWWRPSWLKHPLLTSFCHCYVKCSNTSREKFVAVALASTTSLVDVPVAISDVPHLSSHTHSKCQFPSLNLLLGLLYCINSVCIRE